MINLLIGAPGGGKSYEACVYHILPALQRGRKVITNLPVNIEMFAALDPAYRDLLELRRMPQPVRGVWAAGTDGPAFRIEGEPRPQPLTTRLFSTVWDYYSEWRHPSGMGPLYVIDECQLALPKGGTDKHVAEWYSLHRHYNCDVLLLTQAYGRIEPAVRDLVQLVYRVRKAVALGMSGSYIRKVQDGVRGEVVSTSKRQYEKKWFKLYRSHTQGASVDEQGASDTRPIWMAWPILGAGVCFAIFAVAVLGGGLDGLLTPRIPEQQKQPVRSAPAQFMKGQPADMPQHVPPVISHAVAGPADLPVEPYANRGIHLTGFMTKPGGSTVWTFALSQQGRYLHGVTAADLEASGYRWRPFAPCAGELSFGTVRRAVICDSPQVSLAMGPAAGSGVSTVGVDPLALAHGAASQAREGTPLAGGSSGARSAP